MSLEQKNQNDDRGCYEPYSLNKTKTKVGECEYDEIKNYITMRYLGLRELGHSARYAGRRCTTSGRFHYNGTEFHPWFAGDAASQHSNPTGQYSYTTCWHSNPIGR